MSFSSLEDVYRHLLDRAPENKIEPRLDPMHEIMNLLGDPQKSYAVIHVTGTNGKTSTARMIEAGLRAAGLRTGRYTSPHLNSITERISIDGIAIDENIFIQMWNEIEPYVDMVDQKLIARTEPKMTFFEVMTALAFAIGADAPIDVFVVEVGMGGITDATNVVEGKVNVFTPISFDHTDYLGDSLEEIAEEKSGIIKDNSYVISSIQDRDVAQIILDESKIHRANFAIETVEFAVKDRQLAVGGQVISVKGLAGQYDNIMLALYGSHQAQNAAVAIAALEAFLGQGKQALGQDLIETMFRHVDSPARMELLRSAPPIIVDAAHNLAGIKASALALEEVFQFDEVNIIFGALSDKDCQSMMEELDSSIAQIKNWFFVDVDSPRVMPADHLGEIAQKIGIDEDHINVVPELPNAIESAIDDIETSDDYESENQPSRGIFIIGSVVLAASARHVLDSDKKDEQKARLYEDLTHRPDVGLDNDSDSDELQEILSLYEEDNEK